MSVAAHETLPHNGGGVHGLHTGNGTINRGTLSYHDTDSLHSSTSTGSTGSAVEIAMSLPNGKTDYLTVEYG